MFKNMKAIWNKIKSAAKSQEGKIHYRCKILSIEQDEDDNYLAQVQLVNRNQILTMRPEEILADDELTMCFSPLDVRALTYLGYKAINSPEYKILAQRLSATNKRLVFAIKQKGNKRPIIKTAEQLSSDDEIISKMSQEDAHIVGYTTGSEKPSIEKQQRKELLDKKN